jgi:hypothetical protein
MKEIMRGCMMMCLDMEKIITVGVVVVCQRGEGNPLGLLLGHIVETGDFLGDIKEVLDWEVVVVCQSLCPNLALVPGVCLHIQDLFQGVAKILLKFECFQELG